MEEMKASAEKHNINVNIYEYDESSKTYDISEQWFFNESFKTRSALLFYKGQIIHKMYIIDPERPIFLYNPNVGPMLSKMKTDMQKKEWKNIQKNVIVSLKRITSLKMHHYIPEKSSIRILFST